MDELLTIVDNIESLLQQIKQSSAGEATKQDAPVPEENIPPMPPVEGEEEQISPDLVKSISNILKGMEEEEKKKKEDAAKKAKKSAEGATASDDAEDLIEDQPEVNLENISEVAKAFIKIARMQKGLPKGTSTDVRLYKAVEVLADRLAVQDNVLKNLIEGMGLANNIQKSMETPSKKEDQKPLSDPQDLHKSLEHIRRELGMKPEQKAEGTVQPDQHTLMKSLADDDGKALKMIFSGRKF